MGIETGATGWTVRDHTLDEVARTGLFGAAPAHASLAWWRTLEAAGVGGRFRTASLDGRAMLALPLACGGTRGLAVPYTWRFEPIVGAGCDLPQAGAALGRSLGGVLVLEGTDPEWAGWTGLLAGFRSAGRLVQPFASFANRFERLEGRGWEAYLADRPSALRTTIRRRLARAEADPLVRFRLGRTGAEVADGMAAYLAVAERSWKPRETLPAFLPALAGEAGAAGWLRSAVLRRDGAVVAAQIWSVEGGVAIVHKLAHDAEFDAMSPGTALTAWTIRTLIGTEGIGEVDFGRGDDAYKSGWARGVRWRRGLVVSDPLSVAGAAAIGRQALADAVRRIRGQRR